MRFPFRSSRGWWLGAAAATLCSVLLLQGCDNERITTTEEGFTTENEVYAKWGQPENVWDGPDGVRILGEVKKEYADLLRRADAIFIEELRNFKDDATGKSWYELTSQAFTVFLPVKSVGVMGDGRTYEYVVALRAVQTSDFMTADWAELPYALLKKVSGRIINEVRGINRVTYDVSSKPPATIEWE